jgi:hypothetical protein
MFLPLLLQLLWLALLFQACCAVSNNRWVATGYGNSHSFAYSDNGGQHWTPGGAGPFENRFYDTAHNGGQPGRWIAVGKHDHNGVTVAYSDDNAVSWVAVAPPGSTITFAGLHVTYYPQIVNRWIAVGYGGISIAYSSDNGLNWAGIALTMFTFRGLIVRCNHLGTCLFALFFHNNNRKTHMYTHTLFSLTTII